MATTVVLCRLSFLIAAMSFRALRERSEGFRMAIPVTPHSFSTRIHLTVQVLLLAASAGQLFSQQPATVAAIATRLASVTALTGYERGLVDTLIRLLPGARRDRAANAVLTLGQGHPRRLVLCPLDEPGYVVGSLRDDGYLTLRRVPGRVSPLFDQQLEGHRVTIYGSRGPVQGVVAVRSIHLTRGRVAPDDDPFSVDDAYVVVAAASRAEATGLGLAVLAPVTLAKRPHAYGEGLLAAPATGRRAACAALVTAAQAIGSKVPGPVVVAFAVEQELGQRGLATLANALGPFDETLIVDGGAGVRGALQQVPDPETAARWTGLGTVTRWLLPVSYAGTAVETVGLRDAELLHRSLVQWIGTAP